MGIFFNRKTQGGSVINKKFLADKDLHNKDIRELSHSIGIHNKAGQHKFKEMLMKDQHGGLTREELHDDLQELIGCKFIANTAQAREIGEKLGLQGNKSFLKFDNLTKYHQKQHLKKIEEARKNQPKSISQPNQAKNETKSGPAAPQNKSAGEAKPAQPSTRLSSGSYAQNLIVANDGPIEGGNGRADKERSVYDVIRERNKME